MTATESQASTSVMTQVYGKLPAQDVERARIFYAEKLGLTPFWERAQHLHYKVGGAHFIIYPSTGRASGTHDQLGLVVEDAEAEVARLKSLGVSFESYPPPPGVTMTNDREIYELRAHQGGVVQGQRRQSHQHRRVSVRIAFRRIVRAATGTTPRTRTWRWCVGSHVGT